MFLQAQDEAQSPAEPPFDATMKCKFSEAAAGLPAGLKVNVRYDRADHGRVVLNEDLAELAIKVVSFR